MSAVESGSSLSCAAILATIRSRSNQEWCLPINSPISATAQKLLTEGRRLFDAGMTADAIELLGRARGLAPDDPCCVRWLVEAQIESNLLADASATLEDALIEAPDCETLVVLKAELALERGSLATAESALDAAMACAEVSAATLVQRARVCLFAGEHSAATALLRRSLAIDPRNIAAQSALIVAASADLSMTTARLKALQRSWSPIIAAGADLRWANDPTPDRRLRIGYVSAGFYRHAAAKVFCGVVMNHDPDKFEVYCYASRRKRDGVSIRLRLAIAQWRSIAGLTDLQAARLIRADKIDLLIDLDGHFHRNRLGIFSLRAAPAQASAWGYVPGPGIAGIDYLLTDDVVAPPQERECFSEHLMALPCAQPYDRDLMPRSTAPSRRDCDRGGPIRFGCFNRYDKLNDGTLALWSRTLQACPHSTLTLKDRFFAEPRPRERVLERFSQNGVDPRRVSFETRDRHAQYLASYDGIDLALDPFPITGGVTTLDGLSQGVPVVTLCGAEPSSRIGASILTSLELHHLVCNTQSEYVDRVAELSRDRAALASLRQATLQSFERSLKWGLPQYVRTVETAYREIWSSTCARLILGREAPIAGGRSKPDLQLPLEDCHL
jgi:protein O-GlcNAc transferase